MDQETIEEKYRLLRDEGVVTIDGYMDPETCDELRDKILTEIESGDLPETTPEMEYYDKAEYGEPLLERRGGRDEGMIDVFNMDEAIPEVAAVKNDEDILEIINQAADRQFSPDNINTYYNESVTHTRGYHADTYKGKFKSFVYLTDVPDDSYGPFSYVKGSHDRSKVKQTLDSLLNRLQGRHSTDARSYDESKVVCFTAPKGTLIIANQGGFHRGIPQEEGKERLLITTSYTPR